VSAAEITRFLVRLHGIHDRLYEQLDDVHHVRTVGHGGSGGHRFQLEETDAGVRIGSRLVYQVVALDDPDLWDLDGRDDTCELTISAGVLITPTGCEAALVVTATIQDTALSSYPLGHHVLHEARRGCADSGAAVDALAEMVGDLASPVTFLERLGLVVPC
jgi:hypothetical protein